jgi:RimJ/RimL family protein N-acetyltransferase
MLSELTSERLRLRELIESDIPALFAVFSDPLVMRYWSSLPLTERSEAARLLADIQTACRRGEFYQWGIEPIGGAGIIGTVTLRHISLIHQRAEIGFALATAHEGQGLAREAVSLVLRHAFETMGLYRIEADVDPSNAASLALLQRLGFRREGLLRSRFFVGGERCDSVILGLHREEWSDLLERRPTLPDSPRQREVPPSRSA